MITRNQALRAVDVIGSGLNLFSQQIAGSIFWTEVSDTFSMSVSGCNERIDFTYRDLNRDYGLVLPQTTITQKDVWEGRKEVLLKYYFDMGDTDPLFSVHFHSNELLGIHIQRGNKQKFISYDGNFQTLGRLAYYIFLQGENREQIAGKIMQVVNNSI